MTDRETLRRIRAVCRDGDAIWDRFFDEHAGTWHGFVPAVYPKVYRALRKLRSRAKLFLEWGSGPGTIAIMADLLGFDAYGIEIDPRLVDEAQALAAKHGSNATFVEGSFIPAEYEWNVEHGDAEFQTELEGEAGYDELGLELVDFDLVYAYPWPDEEPMFHDIMNQCGRPGAWFLTYGAFEGVEVHRVPPRKRRRRERDRRHR
jgi:hypothetical protein